jgi:DNA-binding NarL/FixJ family response regulator
VTAPHAPAPDADARGKPSRRLGVVLVDPLPVVRAGMGMLIDDRPDMEILVEAGTGDEAMEAIERLRRSHVVAVLGLGLEGEHDTFWLIREIRRRFPSFAILACGAGAGAVSISRALFMGADGFADKNLDPVAFLQAVRQAATGEMVLEGRPPELVWEIAERIQRRREVEAMLTERERQVLVVAAEGLTARQIADRLGVRERTITTHLGRIYGKLGVGTRLGAVSAAASSGLVTVGTAE